MQSMEPKRANVLVTGTPGVGKTTLAERIATELGMEHVNVGKFAVDQEFTCGYDRERDCYILDEDKILDKLEDRMVQGHVVVDYHTSEWFPERWFSIVVVPRCANDVLYSRLEARGYTRRKVEENLECEIMQVVLQEARESYPDAETIVGDHETEEDTDKLLLRVKQELDKRNVESR